MRVLIISYLTPLLTPGGAQQVAYEHFKATERLGHEVFFLAAMEDQHVNQFGKPGSVIVPMPGEPNEFLYFPQYYNFDTMSVEDPRSTDFLTNFIKEINPDVVHFHHSHRVGIEALAAARSAAPAAVIGFTFHEMLSICMADGQMVRLSDRGLCERSSPHACAICFPERKPDYFSIRKRYIQSLLRNADFYAFPSRFLYERYVDWGLPRDKCHVIENGQKNLAAAVDQTHCSPGVNRFGFFGQFVDNKGVDLILDALLELAEGDRGGRIVFEINGGNKHFARPQYLAKIEEKLEALRAHPLITVRDLGGFSRADLAARMRRVDWVIVPSTWWEVYGLVLSEAMMFRRPAIVADIGGLGERIRNGINGLTFPARDSSELARVIERASGNASLWKAIRRGQGDPRSEGLMANEYINSWNSESALK